MSWCTWYNVSKLALLQAEKLEEDKRRQHHDLRLQDGVNGQAAAELDAGSLELPEAAQASLSEQANGSWAHSASELTAMTGWVLPIAPERD